jgi:anaerobic dimethyl sulfoxide reductase subunit B (iron-sulfur subunit)
MTYAFTFDASACSGCKACQEACKDKNQLSISVLWRRVIEVSGGEWKSAGSAWENSVFAYNLSLACNHCVHPKCAGVCPADAYDVRPDGIVRIDPSKCMGCGYCAWACPYGAPQYIADQGIMSKCDLCCDSLDAGLPPSCVAACPLRVLDLKPVENTRFEDGARALWLIPAIEHPFPLPDHSRTDPHLVIKPHPAMNNPLARASANREELQPVAPRRFRGVAAFSEFPLVAFTLLSQMAAGMAVFSLAFSPLPLLLVLAIGIALGAGGLVAFLHLGRKRKAWRAVLHPRKSWLSREILMALMFSSIWALSALFEPLRASPLIPWLLALLGIGLVYSMVRVYRLHAVPVWNTWRTSASFYLSAAVLGALGVALLVPETGWAVIAGLALTVELVMALTARPFAGWAGSLRFALILLGVAGTLLMAVIPQMTGLWFAIPVFLVALAAEAIGRWQFYAARMVEHS